MPKQRKKITERMKPMIFKKQAIILVSKLIIFQLKMQLLLIKQLK